MSKVVPLEGFGGGGVSSSLNFKIVAYATEEELMAAQPKENTIGIITTTPISGWIFDSEDPYEILISYQSQACIVNSSVTYFNNILTLNSTPTIGKSYIININGIEHSIIITNSTSESSEDGYIDLVPSGDGYMVRVNDVIESPCTIEMYSKKPENGFIWIAIGTSSTIAFNALKKNGIQVYPIFAKQYVDGAWVGVTAMSYQGGEWAEWWDGTLYEPGNTHDDITGGWGQLVQLDNYMTGTFTQNDDCLSVSASGTNSKNATYTHYKMIDLTEFNALEIELSCTHAGRTTVAVLNYLTGSSSNVAVNFTPSTETKTKYNIDISKVTGKHYITFGVWFSATTTYSVNVYRIKLTK